MGGMYGLCVDRDGVGAVKRETNRNKSRGLLKCTLLSRVHGAIVLRT
jgi:hypothetical protein